MADPATVRLIPEHAGGSATAAAIASAHAPPLQMNMRKLAALEAVFEAIPEPEFDQTAHLEAEAGHAQSAHPERADAEPKPDMDFDQILRRYICASGMAHVAERGWACSRRWQGGVRIVDCQWRRKKFVQLLHLGRDSPMLT